MNINFKDTVKFCSSTWLMCCEGSRVGFSTAFPRLRSVSDAKELQSTAKVTALCMTI
jgi:hypothetical protein